MKVVFKNMIQAYSGNCDGMVYYYNRRLQKFIARRKPKFKPNASSRRLGCIAVNLKRLQLSEAFKQDLRVYADLYYHQYNDNGCTGWSNIFSKLMWHCARTYAVDLETLDREQITSLALPVNTVKAAVDAGLLAPVKGYELLVGEL